MWGSYWTAGYRALLNDRTYALVNVIGLAAGVAATVSGHALRIARTRPAFALRYE